MYTNSMRKTLAIVPARGGSKSIPKKNIVDLNGKPLIAYVIRAIKASASVGRVVVSTDDEEIARVARAHGAEVPFLRPKELAEDATPTIPVIEHALRFLEREERYTPEYVLLIQPTEPFVAAEQIDTLFRLVLAKQADSGITMVPVPRIFHPYHVRRLTDEGYLAFVNPRRHYAHPNRQSDPKRYAFGNLYWFRRDAFFREHKIETGRRVGLEIDPMSAFDINTPLDLEIARILMKDFCREKKQAK